MHSRARRGGLLGAIQGVRPARDRIKAEKQRFRDYVDTLTRADPRFKLHPDVMSIVLEYTSDLTASISECIAVVNRLDKELV